MTSPSKPRVRVNHAGPARAAQTPSEAAVITGKREAVVTDAGGRRITIKKLTPLDQMRLARVVGAENSTNQGYMIYAALAFSVMEIGGELEPPVNTARELEDIVDRLGEEGINAILDGQVEQFQAVISREEARDALKN